jgi:predicted DNA-binding transcriptional regulator YafY
MTYSPVSRLFTVLNLLQSRPSIPATQLAERLSVETRSVRRYITMLQEIGIPVESVRGRYGGYRLLPGFKLPPLMWTEGEALAVMLGLQAAYWLGLSQTIPTIESALAKVERVLPQNLREQAQAVQEKVLLNLPIRSNSELSTQVLHLSMAAYQRKRIRLYYKNHLDEESEREFDCYGLVFHSEQWYAVGYCHLRQDIRIFRLDRMDAIKMREECFTPPTHFDCLNYMIQSFAAIPSRWLVEILLLTHREQIHLAIPAEFATLEETPEGILLRAYDDDLQHTARFLVNIGCPFRVLQPPELTEALRELAESILGNVG